jgi:hypothetical protein
MEPGSGCELDELGRPGKAPSKSPPAGETLNAIENKLADR